MLQGPLVDSSAAGGEREKKTPPPGSLGGKGLGSKLVPRAATATPAPGESNAWVSGIGLPPPTSGVDE